MKKYKSYSFIAVLLMMVVVLSACSTGSSEKSAFPTGKFMSVTSKFNGYVFNEDKTWAYLDVGMIGAEGTYSVKGSQWIENGTDDCPFPGTYEWTFDGSNLSFSLVGEDACEPRRAATDGQTFVLTK
jgi:hypothetical protein